MVDRFPRFQMRQISRLPAACLLLIPVLLACRGERQSEVTGSADVLLITNVRIIDLSDSAPLENAVVAIRGNRIASLGSVVRISVPEGAQVYDGGGRRGAV